MLLRALGAFQRSTEGADKIQAVLGASDDFLLELLAEGEDLWEKLTRDDYDAVLASRAALPQNPRKLLSAIHKLSNQPAVVVFVKVEDPSERAMLLAAGCLAVLWTGLADSELREALHVVLRRRREAMLDRLNATRPSERYGLGDFVSESATMKRFVATAHKVVPSSTSLLVLGETGVGKERLARAIHAESKRSRNPFVAVNCGALPENLLESELFGHEAGAFTGAMSARRGYFELAHSGTLFLDEIGETPLHLQVKLLRALDERRIYRVGGERSIAVDVRIVAATNRDLKADVDAKRFRADLYYRLAVVTLVLPPLRERTEDIPALANSYLSHFAKSLGRYGIGMAPEALDALMRYEWPGNVRELINVIERAVLLAPGDRIEVTDLPAEITYSRTSELPSDPRPLDGGLLGEPFETGRHRVMVNYERQYLTEVLRVTHGRIGEAATRAGVNPRTIYDLMRRHQLRKEDFKVG